MKKNLLRSLVALMAVLLLATGCALADAPRDTLVWAMSAEPASLDPMNTASMNTFTITYALYDCLTISDGNGGYKPYLADEITVSEDGLVYTVKLTKDVYFQDGSKLTVEDIKYSLDRTIAAGWAFDMTLCIDEVAVIDDTTVEIRLNTPFGGMMGSLASPFFSIMSKAYCESVGNDAIKRQPMGTGAYKLTEWASGDRELLRRRALYQDDHLQADQRQEHRHDRAAERRNRHLHEREPHGHLRGGGGREPRALRLRCGKRAVPQHEHRGPGPQQ